MSSDRLTLNQEEGSGFAAFLTPLLLLILAVVFFSPVLFTDRTFYGFDNLFIYPPWFSLAPENGQISHNPLITDPVNQHYLSYLYLKNCLAEKALPLWSDSILCGVPNAFGFSPQSNPLVFLLHLLFPPTTAHDITLFLHMFGAGFFMYLYLRNLHLGSLPAAVGAVSWMFNGTLMVWLEFESWVILSSTLPASLFFLERWFHRRRTLDGLFFVFALCLAVSSGMVHLILYQFLFTGTYILYRYFTLRWTPAEIPMIGGSALKPLVLALLVGVAVSGPLLTSYLALQGDPQRSSFGFQELIRNTGQLHPAYLLTLLFPDLFGNPAGAHMAFIPTFHSTQSYNNYNELCLYAGILPLFLSLASRSGRDQRSLGGFYILVALLSLAMAMGTSLYYPLARFVPGLGYSTPTRILYLFGFAISVLAGLGAHHLQKGIGPKQKKILLGVWFLLFLVIVGVYLAVQEERVIRWMLSLTARSDLETLLPRVKAYLLPSSNVMLDPVILAGLTLLLLLASAFSGWIARTLFLSLALLLLAFDLISFGMNYNTVSPKSLAFPPTDGIRFLQQDRSKYRVMTAPTFLHNAFMAYGIDDIGGYVSLYPKRYGEYLHLSQQGPAAPPPDAFSRWTNFTSFGSPLLDLLNTKYLLLPARTEIHSPSLKRVYAGEMTIYENEKVFPRAFFVPGHILASGRKEAYEILSRFTSEDFKSQVILEQRPSPPFSSEGPGSAEKGDATVTIASYKPDRMEIEVTNSRRGFLVLSDNYDKGWRARVDGSETEVLRANYIMRALPLEAGDHRVVLSFRPTLQIAGVAAAIAGWVALCICIVISMGRRRTR